MKIVVDIPDSRIPVRIIQAIEEKTLDERQRKEILRRMLLLAAEEIDECMISEDPSNKVFLRGD